MSLKMPMREDILIALRGRLLDRGPLHALPDSVWKRTGALNTWGTNAIEGNTLTLDEVERLLLEAKSVGGRPVSDVLETIQHEAAFRGLRDRVGEPIRLLTALELHETVFRGVKAHAGQWRRSNVRIAGSRHRPPRMERVVSLLTDWEREYARRDVAAEAVFALAAWMHHAFEAIHAFEDGNGRVGRLLLNLHFLRHNWPPLHILPPDRDAYLDALERGHGGDLAPLAELLRFAMGRSLVDLLDQVGTADDALKPLKRLARSGPYSAKYLALRAGQGELPAVKAAGEWRTSATAVEAYRTLLGRS